MALQLRQQRHVFGLIERNGLDPVDFQWEEIGGGYLALLRHAPSGFYFTFRHNERGWWVEYQPGHTGEPASDEHAVVWSNVTTNLDTWLQEAKAELETPDLWAELEHERGADARYEVAEDTPFTPDEQDEIGKQLREIEEFVTKKYSLSETEIRALGARLGSVEEARCHLPRRRWANEFVRAMFAAFVMAELPPEAVRDILNMFFQALGHVVSHPLPELPIG